MALEADRDRLQDERATVVERAKLKGALSNLNSKQVEAMLEFAPTSPEADVAYVRRSLGALVERVEFDASTRAVRCITAYRCPPLLKGAVGQSWRPHEDSNPGYRRHGVATYGLQHGAYGRKHGAE